jgi:hypothetical protein
MLMLAITIFLFVVEKQRKTIIHSRAEFRKSVFRFGFDGLLRGLLQEVGTLLSGSRLDKTRAVNRLEMVRLVGLEPTTGKTPVDFKPTAYANFATAAPATRRPENITRGNHPHNFSPHSRDPVATRRYR